MRPPHQHSRINLGELKAQIVKKLGPNGSNQYFYYLNRFLSLKLNKVEFNNLCLKILGRENIPLHNQLICSILKNACTSKTSPSTRDGISKPSIQIIGKDTASGNHHSNGSHDSVANPPISFRKARTGLCDQKGGDHRSPLGLDGKTIFAHKKLSDFNAVSENRDLRFPQKSNNRKEEITGPRKCVSFYAPLCGEPECNLDEPFFPSSPIRAPLGIPFWPVSAGGAYRAPSGSIGHTCSLFNDGVLSDNATLRERMEHIALAEGLEGVSLDSANLLNHGLDSYMKRLIRSCIDLVGPRKGCEVTESSIIMNKRHGYPRPVNGIKGGYQNLVQNSVNPLEVQEQRNYRSISLWDFKVAMEMNPWKLGEDWPLLLEKICINAFEE